MVLPRLPGRVPVARRNILADRRRLMAGVAGIGVAISLIFLFEGLWNGLLFQIGSFADNSGADLFVGDPSNRGLAGDPSVIPASSLERVRSVEGVEAAHPLMSRGTVLQLHQKRIFAAIVGSEPGAPGGPWKMDSGRKPARGGEIVIDRILAGQHGIRLGNRVTVAGTGFRVVGLSADTRTWMTAYLFVTHAAAQQLFRSTETTSFILVNASSPSRVAARIREQTGLSALSPRTIGANDRELLTGIMAAPLNLMVAIAFLAGTLIVALTVYSAIVERSREYGIIKAMGAKWPRVLAIVLGQTAILAALGALAGLVIYAGASRLVTYLRPQFWTRITPGTVLAVAAAAGVMALIAAVVPAVRLNRLEPASVYRA